MTILVETHRVLVPWWSVAISSHPKSIEAILVHRQDAHEMSGHLLRQLAELVNHWVFMWLHMV